MKRAVRRHQLPRKLLLVIVLASCALAGRVGERRTGLASFYDDDLAGKKTASGRRYNPQDFVAAHPTYPPDTIVRVTNLENGKSVIVRIVDRGPSRQNRREGVIIDLSHRAAVKLGFTKDGRVRVRTQVLKWGSQPPLDRASNK